MSFNSGGQFSSSREGVVFIIDSGHDGFSHSVSFFQSVFSDGRSQVTSFFADMGVSNHNCLIISDIISKSNHSFFGSIHVSITDLIFKGHSHGILFLELHLNLGKSIHFFSDVVFDKS